ncbi:hypothetical protein [Streptomyces sp. NPDC050560]|uniref:hypothetical protein n=1 Tax=Streptomyces sp. NPDC050560 TaxID=3365630 RepID=UPI00378C8EE0
MRAKERAAAAVLGAMAIAAAAAVPAAAAAPAGDCGGRTAADGARPVAAVRCAGPAAGPDRAGEQREGEGWREEPPSGLPPASDSGSAAAAAEDAADAADADDADASDPYREPGAGKDLGWGESPQWDTPPGHDGDEGGDGGGGGGEDPGRDHGAKPPGHPEPQDQHGTAPGYADHHPQDPAEDKGVKAGLGTAENPLSTPQLVLGAALLAGAVGVAGYQGVRAGRARAWGRRA